MIDKSLNDAINSEDEDYIMRKIREDHLIDSTVTIHLIGLRSSDIYGWEEQRYIKRELQASLYNGTGNTRNGILGIVLSEATERIFRGRRECKRCGKTHGLVSLNRETTISEFYHNYFIPNNKCNHIEDDRYCVLVKWQDFLIKPDFYIEKAFAKREHPISEKVKVKP
ncbi:molecular chaperone Tir [Chitinophaga sp. 30R24]|uniref:molecular chaperone Tir n=1 Tax=Chitinophaga sp. 30R24 TaxID=3248838 RepID=UPI003B8ED060